MKLFKSSLKLEFNVHPFKIESQKSKNPGFKIFFLPERQGGLKKNFSNSKKFSLISSCFNPIDDFHKFCIKSIPSFFIFPIA